MRNLRPVLAVVAGFAVIVLLTAALFAALLIALGKDRIFEPGTTQPTTAVHVARIAISVLVSVVGGFACARISRSGRPALVLALLVLVGGIANAFVEMNKPEPGPRPDDMPLLEAAERGKEPMWVAFLNPLIGFGGILLGSHLARRRSRSEGP